VQEDLKDHALTSQTIEEDHVHLHDLEFIGVKDIFTNIKLKFWKLVSKHWYKLEGEELEQQSLNRLSRSEVFFAMG